MIVKDLQGNSIKIALAGISQNSNKMAKSGLHLKARQILKELYPSIQILEEIQIPIRKGEHLIVDFFIPLLSIIIEVQGQQHYEKSSLFHKSDNDFMKQKKRDNDKRLFCEINAFTLIELKYDEVNKWQEILKS